jgi:hypothetical protein
VRPVEHFLSQLDKFERRRGNGPEEAGVEDSICRSFIGLTAPVIGKDAAGDLCGAFLNRSRGKGGPFYLTLGYAAAFLLGEFDDSMELDAGAWEAIRNALEDASGEMDLKTLGSLMGDLLSRGKLF